MGQCQCHVTGCEEAEFAGGLCPRHYLATEPHGPVCAVCAVCGKPATARGLCLSHYRKARRLAGVKPAPRAERPRCGEPGCDRDAIEGGYCHKHYQAAKYGAMMGPAAQAEVAAFLQGPRVFKSRKAAEQHPPPAAPRRYLYEVSDGATTRFVWALNPTEAVALAARDEWGISAKRSHDGGT
jgi:hypothetical protein